MAPIIIVGGGTISYFLARKLIEQGRDVAIIEKDHQRASVLSSILDCMVLTGDGKSKAKLISSGIKKESFVIALTGSDETNILSCMIAKNKFSIAKTIALVRDKEIDQMDLQTHGIDHIVNSDKIITNILQEMFGSSVRKKIHRVTIAGGGLIGETIAEHFAKQKIQITIIDKNQLALEKLSEKFSNILIINADITDDTLEHDENVYNTDLFVTTIHNEELNIITCMLAKKHGARKVCALLNREMYLPLAEDFDIDYAKSPKKETANVISKFITSP